MPHTRDKKHIQRKKSVSDMGEQPRVWIWNGGIIGEGGMVKNRYHRGEGGSRGHAPPNSGVHHTGHKQREEREGEKRKEKKTDREEVEKTPFFNIPYTKSNSLPPSNITSLQFTVQVFFPSAVALLLHTSSINLLTAMTLPTTSTSCCSSISLRKACWLG